MGAEKVYKKSLDEIDDPFVYPASCGCKGDETTGYFARLFYILPTYQCNVCRKRLRWTEEIFMYAVQMNDQRVEVPTKKLRNLLRKIRNAARKHQYVRIIYHKWDMQEKRTKVCRRRVAFYSWRDGYFYGACMCRGKRKIRMWDVNRIKRATVMDVKFKGEWEVEL
jgi:hypothetical protein